MGNEGFFFMNYGLRAGKRAFGNAKTAHNDNSSRFCKFVQVNYLESGVVRGAVVQTFLLEQSRVVCRNLPERNFHVFYFLLAGASEEERQELQLLHPEDYLYLTQVWLHPALRHHDCIGYISVTRPGLVGPRLRSLQGPATDQER
ncbi:hypothetical protein JZ751_015513 [Albula glossodonta]|uniref:Myosin motor domain-containing protein n=1 Tax=Albula glossodonta TaxID=121402 RepID=A0A8T2N3H2_9TELE|nr:hypothetical protein JZ751_015513 [Albula glossodonta]